MKKKSEHIQNLTNMTYYKTRLLAPILDPIHHIPLICSFNDETMELAGARGSEISRNTSGI